LNVIVLPVGVAMLSKSGPVPIDASDKAWFVV
jgi:hypothetical protein